MNSTEGYVKSSYSQGIGEIEFYHPKSNSLPCKLLYSLAKEITELGKIGEIRAITLSSGGSGAYCAGASFDELVSLDNFEDAKRFFMGFANVINAMRKCPKLIIAPVHGKIVGGGVGLVSAADYAIAQDSASVRLSELALSIGPFVIGPAVTRKIGASAYSAMTIDFEWRTARWAFEKGLYSKLVNSKEELNEAISVLTNKLKNLNPETVADLKKCFWEGTESWDEELEHRAEMSGKLVLSNFTKNYLNSFLEKRRNEKA